MRSYQHVVVGIEEKKKKMQRAQSRGMASLRRESFFNNAFGDNRNDAIDAKDMSKAAGEMVFDRKRGSFGFVTNPASRLGKDALEKAANRSDPGDRELIVNGGHRVGDTRRGSVGAASAASSLSQKSQQLMQRSVRRVCLD